MKRFTALILTILPFIIWAHQDRYFTYQYNNVTIRFQTGFFFEEINNAKIIGQYAANLSDSLEYREPILLDFIHDYGHSYKGKRYSFLSIGSEEYGVVSYHSLKYDSLLEEMVYYGVPADSLELLNNVEEDVYAVPGVNFGESVVIRQFGYHFDIRETLNLLSYAVENQSAIREYSRTDSLSSYLTSMFYRFESVPKSIIDSVKSSQEDIVTQVLKIKIYCDADSTNPNSLKYSYFSKNGTYQIFATIHDKEILIDTLEQIYSFKPWKYMPQRLFVFEAPNRMRSYAINTFMDKKVERSIEHRIDIDPYEYIRSININWLGGDNYMIGYSNGFDWAPVKRLIYLKNEDVLIHDFDEFINSYRKEKNRNNRQQE